MSIEALLLFLNEKQGNNTRYLRDINRRPDTWQAVPQDNETLVNDTHNRVGGY
jgi:hypothetical protein